MKLRLLISLLALFIVSTGQAPKIDSAVKIPIPVKDKPVKIDPYELSTDRRLMQAKRLESKEDAQLNNTGYDLDTIGKNINRAK